MTGLGGLQGLGDGWTRQVFHNSCLHYGQVSHPHFRTWPPEQNIETQNSRRYAVLIGIIITWPDWSYPSLVQKVAGKPGPSKYCETKDRKNLKLLHLVSAIETISYLFIYIIICNIMTSKKYSVVTDINWLMSSRLKVKTNTYTYNLILSGRKKNRSNYIWGNS